MLMPVKINDGLTNGMRYYWRHKEACDAAAVFWRENNRELLRGIKRRWQLQNEDKCNAANRAYYARHKERKAAEKREWRKANPEKAAEIKKRWMDKYPEKARESQIVRHARRRAHEVAAEGGSSVHCIRFLFSRQYGLCYYCAGSILDGYEIDNIIPISKGGSNWRTNLALACRDCNRCKGNKTEGWAQHWVH